MKHSNKFLEFNSFWSLFILVGLVLQFNTSNAQQTSLQQPSENINFEVPLDATIESKMNLQRSKQSFRLFRDDLLLSRAVLPAATFAKGPTSGRYLGQDTINFQQAPFIDKQPVQGFSAVLNNYDGTYMAMSDNGFGSIENSSDYNLRIYRIKPNFNSFFRKNNNEIDVLSFIELKDPLKHIPFAIVNSFSKNRILTGADFDIESVQRTQNGDFWIGDEFGPFILHFNSRGVLLEPPFVLPDFENEGQELRAPQNPYSEEYSALRVMNAMRAHAEANGSTKTPVMSPWFVMLDDGNEDTKVGDREDPPASLAKASSELFKVSSLNSAGFPVVAYTINDLENMNHLLALGLQGLISDRPDLLLQAVESFDGNGDGNPDYLDKDGLIDVTLFDAQGHRGGRGLRPENTLPAMEAALDFLMPTLETDCGITKDGVPVLDHDPHIEAAKTRKADSSQYTYKDEVLVKDLTLAEIQKTFVADKLLNGRAEQTNDLKHSPVAVAFAEKNGFLSPYIMPSLQQLFDFVSYYEIYYKSGSGSSHPDALRRWKNAGKVRFNVETKINPRTDTDDRGVVFAERTFGPEIFTNAIAKIIVDNKLQDRADIQSFDFRTLLLTHKNFPEIRTVCLLGDFPKVGASGDGTNLQDQDGKNTPWLAGLYWPYRSTKNSNSFLVKGSGGFEGMAISTDGKKLFPLLEKPLVGAPEGALLIHEFDIKKKAYNGKKFYYQLDTEASAIGDFIMFGNNRGLIIERDGSQGDLSGFKSIYEVELSANNSSIEKRLSLNLLDIKDYFGVSKSGSETGDVGIGRDFAFPFVTIESVVVFNPFLIGVLNDNNYPFSIGRHVGSGKPDDNEFILVWLDEPLGRGWNSDHYRVKKEALTKVSAYPNTFSHEITIRSNAEEPQQISVTIYDFSGKVVKQLVEKEATGKQASFKWNGNSENGIPVSSGVYIAVIESNGQFYKQKLIKE